MASSTSKQLLVATPAITDGIFSQTVVYMIHHSPQGAVGVILNQPMLVGVEDILTQWAPHARPSDRLFNGGPVGQDGLLALGRRAGSARGVELVDLNGDRALEAGDLELLRVFRGHAGWGPLQLDGELARGDWFAVPTQSDDVFTTASDTLYERVLRRQSGSTRWFANAPDDLSVN